MNTITEDQATAPYTLLVLAGGAGRRMAGRDKGLQLWRGKPLVAHVVGACPGANQRLISCNRNLTRYAAYGETVADTLAGYQGPLAGLLPGLQCARHDHVLVLPCDCPQPPLTLYPRLYRAGQEKGTGICYAWDGERQQYLFALIQRGMAASLFAYLDSGQRSVHGWYRQQNATQVDFSDQREAFLNFNKLQDL